MITTEGRRVVVAAAPVALDAAVGELAKVGLAVTPVLGTIGQLGYFDVDPRSTPEQRAAAAERSGLRPEHVAVLEGFADGLSNAEIAERVDEPLETVRSRVSRTLRLLRVGSREEAVLVALRRGVLDGGAR